MNKDSRLKQLEVRLDKLEKLVLKTNKYITYMELRSSGLDPAYDDALKLIKGKEFITYHWLQSKLDIGYARTQNVLDKLEEEGKIEHKIDNREKRKVKI